MKNAALLFAAVCLAAAGFGGGWLTARKSLPSAGVAEFSAPNSEIPENAAKNVSPEAALPAGSGLQAHIEILQHVAGLPLAEVQARAGSTEFRNNALMTHSAAALMQEALFTRWAELDAEGLLAAAQTSNDSGFQASAIESAFNALAKTDWKEAMRRAHGKESGLSEGLAQRAVLRVLVEADPALAFKQVIEDPRLKFGWIDSVILSWAASDPAAAAAASLTISDHRKKTSAVAALMQQWAAKDYSAAAAWGETLGPALRREALYGALQTLAHRNPAEALKELRTTDIGGYHQDVVVFSIRKMAQLDFEAAFKAANSFTSPSQQSLALGALTGAASGEDRRRLLKLAAEMPPNLAASIYQDESWHHSGENVTLLLQGLDAASDPALRERLLPRAVQSLALFHPTESGRLFMELPPHARTPDAARIIAEKMARQNPAEALRWAEGLGAGKLENTALIAVLDHLKTADPAAAEREILKISEPQMRAERIQSLAEAMADSDSAKAEQWAAGLTGPDRLVALRAVTEQTTENSLEQARDLYEKYAYSLSPEEAEAAGFQRAALKISQQWAAAEPSKAASWTVSLAEGEARDVALAGVISLWTNDDPLTASEWVNSQPPGANRDIAATELVRTIARSDPDSAWIWAENIADPARRSEAAAVVLDGWKANNQTGEARAALENGNFSDSDRQDLARRLE